MTTQEALQKARDLVSQNLLRTEIQQKAAIKDLELQWHDHFHMRDQAWKSLSNSGVMFLGVVGLEIYKGFPAFVMIAAYAALIGVSWCGYRVALHHRDVQQNIKFPIILRYEMLLGLMPVFEDIIAKHRSKGLGTSTYIVVAHQSLAVIAALLLLKKLYDAIYVTGLFGLTAT